MTLYYYLQLHMNLLLSKNKNNNNFKNETVVLNLLEDAEGRR